MYARRLLIALMVLALAACAESAHQTARIGMQGNQLQPSAVPAFSYMAEPQRHQSATERAPEKIQLAQGQSVTVSGLVLKATRLDGYTEIEILQLPVNADGRPTEDRRQSQGRLLARQIAFLDPVIFATKPMVTVSGVVDGEIERPLQPGSDNYAYPVVTIHDLTVWPHELLQPHTGFVSQSDNMSTISSTEPETGFMSNLLGAIFSRLGQALLNQNRREYRSRYNSSYDAPPSSSSSSPNRTPPAENDIPPQFKKRH